MRQIPEPIRLAAERQGLGKALEIFPEGVKAAYERGARTLGDHPGMTQVSAPAAVFDPTRFEEE